MASAAPLLAVQGDDELVVSPELALIDPQLAAVARARLPEPPPPVDRCERPAPPFEPARGSAAQPAIAVVGRWLLSALFAVSIAGNVVALRYAWDNDVSPQAELAVVAPVPQHLLGTSYSKSPEAVGAAKAAAAASSRLTAVAVQARVLRELASAPALRRQFAGAAGIVVPAVSARCSPRPVGGANATFRCVVWRQSGSMRDGVTADVRVLRDQTLSFSVVGGSPSASRSAGNVSKSPKAVGAAKAAAAASSRLTAVAVQARVLRELASAPALRRQFVGAAGVLVPAVSARCSQRRVGGANATFRCVVWRQSGSMRDGVTADVRVLRDQTLSFSVVGGPPRASRSAGNVASMQ